MKHIVKDAEPAQFAEWMAGDRMAHRPRWNRVPADVRRAVHDSLIREQGALCCYCEGRVVRDDSHVEHFRPIAGYEDEQLQYVNLHCSCGRAQTAGEPRHCGHRKGSWFDEDMLVSPLMPECEGRFRYTGDGRIHATDGDAAAASTIDRLGLDLPKLRALRAASVDALADLPAVDVEALLAARTPEGEFLEYYTTVRQLLA